jgi:NAD(P)-dependent dehydrogenase (short-subunit alcohol dehydrogenase family)
VGTIWLAVELGDPSEAIGWVDYYVANLVVQHLVRGLGEELRPTGVRVNALAPWFVATEPVKRFYPEESSGALSPLTVAESIASLLGGESEGPSGEVLELHPSTPASA